MDEQRYGRFADEVGALPVGASDREVWLGRLGVALALLGPVIGVIAYIGSLSAEDDLGQRDMVVLALIGVSVTLLGVGLFLRYSVVRFFRFWAARIVVEIGAAAGGAGTGPTEASEADETTLAG